METSIYEKLSIYLKELSLYDADNIDYKKITANIQDLSGASFATLNLFNKSGNEFQTVAFTGIKEHIEKTTKLLGFRIDKKVWPRDTAKDKKTSAQKTTVFQELNQLTGEKIPKNIITFIEQTFGIGEVVVIKIFKDISEIGDFTLFFKKEKHLIYKDCVETYADVCGLLFYRIEAEKEIIKQKDMLENFFNVNLDLLCIASLDGYFLKTNKEFEHVLGYDSNELISKPFIQLIHPDDISATKDTMAQLSKNEKVHSFVNRYRCKNGDYRYIEWRSLPVGDLIYAAARDITERIYIENSLMASESRLKTLVANLPGFVYRCTFDKDWTMTYISEGVKEITGYNPEDLIENRKLSFADLISPEDNIRLLQKWHQAIKDKSRLIEEYQIRRKDGTVRWIWERGYGVFDINDNLLFLEGFITDITERKTSEAKLEASEIRFRNLFENNHVVMLIIEPASGVIVDANPAAVKFYGYRRDKLVGMHINNINKLAPNDIQSEMKVALRGERNHFYFTHCLADGSERQVEVLSGSIEFDGKEHLYSIVHDDTARRTAEDELKLAKEFAEAANNAKSEFLANMNHELRTPLNGVIGFTELLMSTSLNDLQKQYVENALVSANSLLGIISDILDYSKIEAGKLELELIKCDIIEILEQAVDIIKIQAARKGIELMLNIQPDMPDTAVADPLRLKQILINLLSNAVKFTAHGEIEISITFNPIDKTKGQFNISVRDTGIGISEIQQKTLFKAFTQADSSTTRKYGGTGLGLTISNLLARKMGSNITFSSNEGIGSTFSFSFVTAFEKTSKNNLPDFSKIKRILIIDDNSNNRKILEHLLHNEGISTTSADSGYNALKILEKQEPFDLIITDFHMPQMNGIEVIRLMQKKLHLTPDKQAFALIHSAFDDYFIHEECRNLGVRFAISKPVKPRELFYFISHLKNTEKHKEVVQPNLDKVEYNNVTIKTNATLLIAEDNEMNMWVIKKMAENMAPGLRIIEAINGLDVMDCLNTYVPDLILMDIQMPELDGLETTRLIRNLNDERIKNVPIVALTAGTTKIEKDNCFTAGMDGFITKPIEKISLKNVLDKFFITQTTVEDYNPKQKYTLFEKHFNRAELLSLIEGEDDVIKELLAMAIKQYPDYIKKLNAAFAMLNISEIKSVAHSIKGSAANLCFSELCQIAEKIEINAENTFLTNTLIKKLTTEWAVLEDFIRQEYNIVNK